MTRASAGATCGACRTTSSQPRRASCTSPAEHARIPVTPLLTCAPTLVLAQGRGRGRPGARGLQGGHRGADRLGRLRSGLGQGPCFPVHGKNSFFFRRCVPRENSPLRAGWPLYNAAKKWGETGNTNQKENFAPHRLRAARAVVDQTRRAAAASGATYSATRAIATTAATPSPFDPRSCEHRAHHTRTVTYHAPRARNLSKS